MRHYALLSTMMDSLQSCRAAAGGSAPLPAGTVWPAGTHQQLLSQTQACRGL